jgi:hypothetical protein
MAVIKDTTDVNFLPHPSHARFVNITNKVFGRLTVLGYIGKNKKGRSVWLCECDCGNYVSVVGYSLEGNNTTSCGCYWKEKQKDRNFKHGQAVTCQKTKVYAAWRSIINRCYNETFYYYKNYGGRGITIAQEWRNDFISFYAHVGDPPSNKHSIDRIDNDKGYIPGNLRWATASQQSKNRSNTIILEFNGIKRCISEWARVINVKQQCIYYRYKKGWCTFCIFTTPTKPGRIHTCTHCVETESNQ